MFVIMRMKKSFANPKDFLDTIFMEIFSKIKRRLSFFMKAKKPSSIKSRLGIALPTELNSKAKTIVKAPPAPKASLSSKNRIETTEIPVELIQQRAYYIWESQGRPEGKDQENWIQAEKELRRELFR
jgi:hypothetical protein